jgi:peptide/nickel transport system ATP-binding protein
MYLGKIVEIGKADTVITRPTHPYTQALLRAAPVTQPKLRRKKKIPRGEIPNPAEIPSGCRFHPRCPLADARCKSEEPELVEVEDGHFVACHYWHLTNQMMGGYSIDSHLNREV